MNMQSLQIFLHDTVVLPGSFDEDNEILDSAPEQLQYTSYGHTALTTVERGLSCLTNNKPAFDSAHAQEHHTALGPLMRAILLCVVTVHAEFSA